MLQAYLTGQETPSLYVTYYWDSKVPQQHVSILSAPLEAALQQLVAQPSLGKPKGSNEVPNLSGPNLAAPGGQVGFVDSEVEDWVEAGGIERVHAAHHKVSSLILLGSAVSLADEVQFLG